jgi:hypothetical protein
MSLSRERWLLVGGAAVIAAGVVFLGRGGSWKKAPAAGEGAETETKAESGAGHAGAASSSAVADDTVPASRPGQGAAPSGIVARLGWGSGPGRIGKPAEDEGQAETPLRMGTDSAGHLLLLDAANGRLLRLAPDGGADADVTLPIKQPRDVTVAKDGTILLLDPAEGGAGVMLLGPDGRTRGKLSLPPGLAEQSRSVLVSGKDVYVESHQGELTRVGDVRGTVDPEPSTVPGQPTRDGRGYVSARIVDAEAGRIHVYVVERSLQQRFSRQLQLSMPVEGIFLVDSNPSGTIYIGVTGNRPEGTTVAQLLCLEPEKGTVIGKSDVPVTLGGEAILDAKALDSGGIAYSVFTEQGLRVERLDCL